MSLFSPVSCLCQVLTTIANNNNYVWLHQDWLASVSGKPYVHFGCTFRKRLSRSIPLQSFIRRGISAIFSTDSVYGGVPVCQEAFHWCRVTCWKLGGWNCCWSSPVRHWQRTRLQSYSSKRRWTPSRKSTRAFQSWKNCAEWQQSPELVILWTCPFALSKLDRPKHCVMIMNCTACNILDSSI